MTIPGVGELGACEILAETGPDMSRFPSHRHLVSWAGLCPRNDESAGRRRSNRLRRALDWLKVTLVQCAWAAVKKKDSCLCRQFHRLRARRGAKKAACAVAASILVAVFHMLRDGTCYADQTPEHLVHTDRERIANRLRKRLIKLGYQVSLKPAEAA